MIHIENICKRFGTLEVLRGISLDVADGEVVAIVGASGAGKTTLLQIIGTLSRPDEGSVLISKRNVFALDDCALSRFRNEQIGFVFQFHHLLPEFTAFENVCIPGLIGRRPRAEVESRARELLDLMGLSARCDHKPGQLSGGEQQRVAIARALINSPAVLLADEPSGNLDTRTRDEIHRLFFELRDKLGQTVVIVTHDEHLAAMSDRKITMSDGRIIFSADAVSEKPVWSAFLHFDAGYKKTARIVRAVVVSVSRTLFGCFGRCFGCFGSRRICFLAAAARICFFALLAFYRSFSLGSSLIVGIAPAADHGSSGYNDSERENLFHGIKHLM